MKPMGEIDPKKVSAMTLRIHMCQAYQQRGLGECERCPKKCAWGKEYMKRAKQGFPSAYPEKASGRRGRRANRDQDVLMKRVEKAMLERSLTPVQFATLSGLSVDHFNHLLNGHNYPSLQTSVKLNAALEKLEG